MDSPDLARWPGAEIPADLARWTATGSGTGERVAAQAGSGTGERVAARTADLAAGAGPTGGQLAAGAAGAGAAEGAAPAGAAPAGGADDVPGWAARALEQLLTVTYWLDPGELGEPFTATIRFTGHRTDVAGAS